MITAGSETAQKAEFENLLFKTTKSINQLAANNKLNIKELAGKNLEPFIAEIMDLNADGTLFKGKIEIISGQRFPDIISLNYFGVEVKSTTQSHWITTGNSVTENTRVAGIERIYMMFGRLGNPVEFRVRPYEECLSEVVVTHSPRYIINMELPKGQTIFDKMGLSYDSLRKMKEPIEPIKNYYGSKLPPGRYSWWLPGNTGLLIRLWNTLTVEERTKIVTNGFILFPELFSNRRDKFNQLALWLVQSHSVVCPNIRDEYSAGGRENIIVNHNNYKNVPRILINALELLPKIQVEIQKTPKKTLEERWNFNQNNGTPFSQWLKKVHIESNKMTPALDTTRMFVDYKMEFGI